jgi:hypothetical protein
MPMTDGRGGPKVKPGALRVEAQIKGKPPDLRREQLQTRRGPRLEEFKAWLQRTLATLPAKSELAGAICYAPYPAGQC